MTRENPMASPYEPMSSTEASSALGTVFEKAAGAGSDPPAALFAASEIGGRGADSSRAEEDEAGALPKRPLLAFQGKADGLKAAGAVEVLV